MRRLFWPHERDGHPEQRDPPSRGRPRRRKRSRRGLDVSPRGRRGRGSGGGAGPSEQGPRHERVLLQVDRAQPAPGLRDREGQSHAEPRERGKEGHARRRRRRRRRRPLRPREDDGDLDHVEQRRRPSHGPHPGRPPAAGREAAERGRGRPGGREAEVVELGVRGGGGRRRGRGGGGEVRHGERGGDDRGQRSGGRSPGGRRRERCRRRRVRKQPFPAASYRPGRRRLEVLAPLHEPRAANEQENVRSGDGERGRRGDGESDACDLGVGAAKGIGIRRLPSRFAAVAAVAVMAAMPVVQHIKCQRHRE